MKTLTLAITLMFIFAAYSSADIIATQVFEPPVPDGGYSEVTLNPALAAGSYYLELTEPTGISVGAFGTRMDPHAGGQAYQDGAVLEDGIVDLYLNVTPEGGALECLICQQDDNSIWTLMQGHPDLSAELYTSLGQSFTTTGPITSVALRTPTWTLIGGFTATLHTEAPAGVEPIGKLATVWGSLK